MVQATANGNANEYAHFDAAVLLAIWIVEEETHANWLLFDS